MWALLTKHSSKKQGSCLSTFFCVWHWSRSWALGEKQLWVPATPHEEQRDQGPQFLCVPCWGTSNPSLWICSFCRTVISEVVFGGGVVNASKIYWKHNYTLPCPRVIGLLSSSAAVLLAKSMRFGLSKSCQYSFSSNILSRGPKSGRVYWSCYAAFPSSACNQDPWHVEKRLWALCPCCALVPLSYLRCGSSAREADLQL